MNLKSLIAILILGGAIVAAQKVSVGGSSGGVSVGGGSDGKSSGGAHGGASGHGGAGAGGHGGAHGGASSHGGSSGLHVSGGSSGGSSSGSSHSSGSSSHGGAHGGAHGASGAHGGAHGGAKSGAHGGASGAHVSAGGAHGGAHSGAHGGSHDAAGGHGGAHGGAKSGSHHESCSHGAGAHGKSGSHTETHGKSGAHGGHSDVHVSGGSHGAHGAHGAHGGHSGKKLGDVHTKVGVPMHRGGHQGGHGAHGGHHGGHVTVGGGHKQSGPQRSDEEVVTSWTSWFKKSAQKVQELVQKSDWSTLAQFFLSSSQKADQTGFPVSEHCLRTDSSHESKKHGHESGHEQKKEITRITNILKNKDVTEQVKKVDSESKGNGIWVILLMIALGNENKAPDAETTKKFVQIVSKNQDSIEKLIKNDEWDELVTLLEKETKEAKIDVKVDWNKVKDCEQCHEITKTWATEDKPSDVETIIKTTTKSVTHGDHEHPGKSPKSPGHPEHPGKPEHGHPKKPEEHGHPKKPGHDDKPHHPGKPGEHHSTTPSPTEKKDHPGKPEHGHPEKPGHDDKPHHPGKPGEHHSTTPSPKDKKDHPGKPGSPKSHDHPDHVTPKTPAGHPGSNPKHNPTTKKPEHDSKHPGHDSPKKPEEHGHPKKPGHDSPKHPGQPGHPGQTTTGGHTEKTHSEITKVTEKPEVTKTRQEVITKVIKENSDQVKKLVKEGNWEALVKLLNTQSKKSGKTDIDWSKVIDGSKDKNSVWKVVIEQWAESPKDQEDHFDFSSKVEEVNKKTTTNTHTEHSGKSPDHPGKSPKTPGNPEKGDHPKKPGHDDEPHHPGKPGDHHSTTTPSPKDKKDHPAGHPGSNPKHNPTTKKSEHDSKHPGHDSPKKPGQPEKPEEHGHPKKPGHESPKHPEHPNKPGQTGGHTSSTKVTKVTEKPEVTKTRQEVITSVVKENSDQVKKLVKEGNWEALVKLLNTQSKKSGKTDLDWSKVIDGSKDKNSVWKIVIQEWAEAPKDQEEHFDFSSKVEKVNKQTSSGSETHSGSGSTSFSSSSSTIEIDSDQLEVLQLVIKENQQKVQKLVKDGDWEGLVKLLNQTSEKSGKQIDWEKVLQPEKGGKNGMLVLIFRTIFKQVADSDSDNIDIHKIVKSAKQSVSANGNAAAKGSNLVSEIRKVANENREKLTGVIKSGDWEQLAKLLTKLSSKSKTLSGINWESLIGDNNEDKKQRDGIRGIFTSWVEDDSSDNKLNVKEIANEASGSAKDFQAAISQLQKIMKANSKKLQSQIKSGDWKSIGELLQSESKGSKVLSSFNWHVLLSDSNPDKQERDSMRAVLTSWAKNGGKVESSSSDSSSGGELGSLLAPISGMFSFASGKSSSKGGKGGAALPGLPDLGSLGLGQMTGGLSGLFGGGKKGGAGGGFGSLLGGGSGGGLGGLLGGGGGSSKSSHSSGGGGSGGSSSSWSSSSSSGGGSGGGLLGGGSGSGLMSSLGGGGGGGSSSGGLLGGGSGFSFGY